MAILGPSWGYLGAIFAFLEPVLGIPGALAAASERTNDILRKSASRLDGVPFLSYMTAARSKDEGQLGFEIDTRGPELAQDGQNMCQDS